MAYKDRAGQDLTPVMKEVWNARARFPELTIEEIALQLERSPQSVRGAWQSARVRKGYKGKTVPSAMELVDEKKGKKDEPRALESQTSARRVRKELKEVKTERLAVLAGSVSEAALESLHRIEPDDWDKASLKERAITAGILIDKRQILRSEPTAIVEIRDHRRLDEVAQALLQELKRRGITLDPSEYQAQEEPLEPALLPLADE